MTSATNHHDQGLDALVDLLVDANARSHDLWGFLALALARAASRLGSPHRFIGPRWDTEGGGVVLDLIREGASLDTTQLLRWQAENIVETAYGDTVSADRVATAPAWTARRRGRPSNGSLMRAESTVTATATGTDLGRTDSVRTCRHRQPAPHTP